MHLVSIIDIIEDLGFLFERIGWETELLSKTTAGWYLLGGRTDVIPCELLEGMSCGCSYFVMCYSRNTRQEQVSLQFNFILWFHKKAFLFV